MSELIIQYTGYSRFELDFDLTKVHSWDIRNDTLFVVHNAGEVEKEYDPDWSVHDDRDMFCEHSNYSIE